MVEYVDRVQVQEVPVVEYREVVLYQEFAGKMQAR